MFAELYAEHEHEQICDEIRQKFIEVHFRVLLFDIFPSFIILKKWYVW